MNEEEKRAKLEYDSINPAIERVEWQASMQGRRSERSSRSKSRGNDEREKRERESGRRGRKDGSTDDDGGIPHVASRRVAK